MELAHTGATRCGQVDAFEGAGGQSHPRLAVDGVGFSVEAVGVVLLDDGVHSRCGCGWRVTAVFVGTTRRRHVQIELHRGNDGADGLLVVGRIQAALDDEILRSAGHEVEALERNGGTARWSQAHENVVVELVTARRRDCLRVVV